MAIQGFGNAGAELASLLAGDGYTVVAVSDSRGGVHDPDGLDVDAVRKRKAEEGQVGDDITGEELLALDVDLLIPAALEDAITEDNADAVKASVVVEVANGPVTAGADEILAENGVTVVPDILANAGGVTVSYFEWAQNKSGVAWEADDVRERLRARMVTETEAIAELAKDKDIDLRTAAYAHALERIDAAVVAKGSASRFQDG